MNEELADLHEILAGIYQKNLTFLEKEFPELYKRVEEFSYEIASGKKQEKYSLENIHGYFDIRNLQNDRWFYATNSFEDAQLRASHSNFSKDGSLDLLRKGVGGKKLAVSQSLHDVLPIVDYINKEVDFDAITFRRIYKFVFVGTGVGVHIHEIASKLDPFTTLIIEPELEIFRLSMFVIDYSLLDQGNKKLFLSVEEEKTARLSTIGEFSAYHKYMNYNIKHNILIENYQYLLDEVKDFFATNNPLSFPYAKTIENIHRTVEMIKNKKRFLDSSLLQENTILNDSKVLIVAAGPSLDEYIDWIEKNQDYFVVVCVDVIVKKLEKHNITPDIIMSIDPSERCAEFLTPKNKDFLQQSAFVFLSQQHEDVMKVIESRHSYFAQSVVLLEELGFLGSTTNVGTYSFMLSAHFGAKEIYMIGTDAAFDQVTGNRYSKDSSHEQSEQIDIDKEDDGVISSYDVIEVEGNLQEKVKTNRSLVAIKDAFEMTMHSLRGMYEFEAYNLSSGVKLEGFEPLSYEAMNTKIKTATKKTHEVISRLDSVSKVVDRMEFAEDVKILNSILTRVKKHKTVKFKDRDDFLEKKLDIMLWSLEKSKTMSSTLFGNMFLLYTELSDIYINFMLNLRQKELHNKKHLGKINMYWSDGLIKLIKDIKKAIS